MKIAFFASGISPHISPLCDELYKYCNGEFRFFATDKEILPAMKIMGAENLHKEKTYFVNVNDSKEKLLMSEKWAKEADVAIVGCSNCYRYIDIRFESGDKLTFKLKERIFKTGEYIENDVRLQRKACTIQKYKNNNLYFLSAGIFTPYDLTYIGINRSKIIKWGYFPKLSEKLFERIERNFDGTIQLIWFGRFVREKLSLNAIKATECLLNEGYDVHLSMIGYGEEENKLKSYVNRNKLEETVSFLGPMNEKQIRAQLQQSHVFLMTSNYEEGWGVVVNEAMSEGCIPVVSYATGASQMLIEDIKCGQLFFYEKVEDLVEQLKILINDRESMKKYSENAYAVINNTWNATIAVERLMNLIHSILEGTDFTFYKNGPCSEIIVFKNEEEVYEYQIVGAKDEKHNCCH